jgi:hypothetical protein
MPPIYLRCLPSTLTCDIQTVYRATKSMFTRNSLMALFTGEAYLSIPQIISPPSFSDKHDTSLFDFLIGKDIFGITGHLIF